MCKTIMGINMASYQVIDRGRGPELAGTRFTVFDILPYLKKGRHPDYIAATSGLAVEQVKTLIDYIEAHKDEVMAMNQRIEERIAKGNTAEVAAKLQALRGSARARRAELLNKRQEANGDSRLE
jgi:uncharacterized protein (DUF433 family)